ncbi:NAD(+) diphosphatase [Paracoccus seriniphilus]|uniref:NAD(+) diphosphatase n=1 Tax=Paracoccus seriniphilus TaxID=184748 RepID=A0A239Q317_9RHOB|nr:NAD(+) diphosphatase [Paracoccus seriniphilus]WCR15904.1 NAD(+) diphosphatase [Paracoccus seriniphilus]SNT76327.1 NAD+ diphosphatase [Paracoccus seriniphilus]
MIPETAVTFAGSFLDRADRLRSDEAGMAARLADPSSMVSPFWRGKPLFDETPEGPRLAWLSSGDALIADCPEAPIFMGLDQNGISHFAADVSYIAPPDQEPADFIDERTLDLSQSRKFIDLRTIMGEIDHRDAGIAAAAKGIFEWRNTHRFCSNCGHENRVCHAGWRFDCPGCGRQHFPRTDPVVIMLVLDGDRVLLGRQSVWPERMYSLLAGFMEPGETVEEAVRREVEEESSVVVGEVRYVTSQPWPFPASLMIGCVGKAETTEITIDQHELEDAIWVSRSEVAQALAGQHDRISPARKGAVAQVMLQAWVDGTVRGFAND